jgi:hypothetical protein
VDCGHYFYHYLHAGADHGGIKKGGTRPPPARNIIRTAR